MRYIAVDREALRRLLFEDGSLSDLLLTAFVERREALQQWHGIGVEIFGPRASDATRRLLDFARQQRFPHTWIDTAENEDAAALVKELGSSELPLVRLPGGVDARPRQRELSRALGVGLEPRRARRSTFSSRGGPAGLGAAVYGSSEGLDTLLIEGTGLGGQAGASRRIEKTSAFPAGSAAPS